MDKILSKLKETFNPDHIADWIIDVLPGVVTALLVFVAFWIVWRVLRAGLTFVMQKADVDKTVAAFVKTATQYVVMTIAVLMALAQLGIDTASILASLGVVGLTVGFAAKDALSNILSGLFIFWDRPFTVNDLVEISGHYGRVDAITLRSTRVVTPDGKMLAFPNTMVVNNVVASYTNFPNLRLDVEVTVAVTENLGNVRRVLLDMIEGHEEYLTEHPPACQVKALNDYNVLFEVRAWIEDERSHVRQRFLLRERIFNALNEAGVEMPYETIQLAPIDVRQQEAA